MIPIKQIMTRNVQTVTPEDSMYDALNLLIKLKISGLPVVNDQNEVVGILSEKDVLRLMVEKDLSVGDTVEKFMSRNVTSFGEDEDAVEICKFFLKSHFRRVPIVKNKKLIGLVSRHDIVWLIHEAQSKLSDLRYD